MRYWLWAAAAALLLGPAVQVQALPAYAIKEGKPCAYCHIRAAGGGPRNFRGIYYGTHNHSFVGFNENGAAGPSFRNVWQEILAAKPTRIGVTDRGDNHLILVLVNPGKDADSRTIAVQSWDPETQKLVQDATLDTTSDADRMETGHFGADKSPAIVLPTGYILVSGKELSLTKGAGAEKLAGAARTREGVETVVTFDGKSTGHNINPRAGGDGWLTDGPNLPPGTRPVYVWAEARGADLPQIVRTWNAPGDVSKANLVGVWDPNASGQFYYYLPQHIEDRDNAGDYVVVYSPAQAGGGQPAQVWKSPRLAGKVVDIAQGPDIRTGKQQGLYVLTDGAATGNGSTLYFFGLQ